MWKYLIGALAGAVLAGDSPAQDNTYKEVEAAVRDKLAPQLSKAGVKTVTFGRITWQDSDKPVATGAGVSQAVADCLAAHDVGVSPGQGTVVSGTLAPVAVDPESGAPALKLTLRLDGAVKCETVRMIFGDDVLHVEGIELALPPTLGPDEVVVAINKARTEPVNQDERTAGSKRVSCDKTVTLEMLVAPRDGNDADFAPRSLDAQGRARVTEGEKYRLRITSSNPWPIAAELKIDGLCWSAFSQIADGPAKKPARLLVMVPANGSTTVRGWALKADKSLAFDVTRLPALAAGRQADAGVATLTYGACWDVGATPPEGDEPRTRSPLRTDNVREQADRIKVVTQAVGKTRGSVKLLYGDSKQ